MREKIQDRVMIFIDNSNIFNGFQKYKIKADYEKLKNIITGTRKLEGIFLYEGVVYPINPSKIKWYEDLKKDFLPLLKKLKKLKKEIEVWAFKYALANVLKEEIDKNDLFFIDDVVSEIKI
ncbi:MAG: hypothetical protein P8Y70_13670 [Candidatus Lokiarchaeota archaeon]